MNMPTLPPGWFVTDWFGNNIEKPSRPGVYQVRHPSLLDSVIWWAKWDGNNWLLFGREYNYAQRAVFRTSYNTTVLSWRGVIQPHQCKLCGNGKFEHHRLGLRCLTTAGYHLTNRYTAVN